MLNKLTYIDHAKVHRNCSESWKCFATVLKLTLYFAMS